MKKRTLFLSIFLIAGLIMAFFIYSFYKKIYGPEIHTPNGEVAYLYIPTHSRLIDLKINLVQSGFIRDTQNFNFAAKYLHFNTIKPGKYEILNGSSYKSLFRKIQLGQQVPVDLILHNLRLRENLASFIGHHLEADSLSIMQGLNDRSLIDSLGFNYENFYVLFIPNTYQFKWNTNAHQFFLRMNEEYKKFWNPERLEKASKHGLNPINALILASIVTQESNKPEDMGLIAGVYLNRLRVGIRLEADPTVVYANQDFTIRRVTQKYLVKDSPYNTYKYMGLPPGPITMPTLQAIEAVLNSPNTQYLYFCAKDDFSGNHAFAITREQHIQNARKFHEALNARNIH